MKQQYEIAAYYFPNFHPDDRNSRWHGQNWTEWKLLQSASPRFAGHQQPKVPLWGYEDESLPEVMERKIDVAVAHSLSAFIFDWYWYDDGPFLQRCLEDGFLKAKNVNQLKFAIMWANHDWTDIHPGGRAAPYHTLTQGSVSEKTFIKATNHMIQKYFSHPSYWRINGGLYLSIYELMSLMKGLGGAENTSRLLKDFRKRVSDAGLGELHLNAVVWGIQILPGETNFSDHNQMLEQLGFDSVTSYVWVHHQPLITFPEMDYIFYRNNAVAQYPSFTQDYKLPYYPNVTMGWDPSPRTIQSDIYENQGYPFTPILTGNTPNEFRSALAETKRLMELETVNHKILTINAWNEWTEGSYLEPDTQNGMGYLEAIKQVFAPNQGKSN